MKLFYCFIFFCSALLSAQKLGGVQVFNPQTNDNTPIIPMNGELIFRFDDLENSGKSLQYTLKHFDRNWQDDGLFFTEIADGKMTVPLTNNNFSYSFNTLQKYTHYEIILPNENMRPKISGNYELIIYEYDPEQPLLKQRFSLYENQANTAVQVNRIDLPKQKENQRIEVKITGTAADFSNNVPSMSLSLMQNNNFSTEKNDIRPTGSLGNSLLFQSMDMIFPGNSEFYYFDNKNIQMPADMVAGAEQTDQQWYTYLHPVFAYPTTYQYQPDVNGAFYFRRNDSGMERNANLEGDYSWVHFYLDSPPVEHDLYILGQFNNYQPTDACKMQYDATQHRYVAKIFLKQGFYSYLIAVKNDDGTLDYGAVNGNFWQTENLYQALLYYRPFGRNYDGIASYGEYRRARR